MYRRGWIDTQSVFYVKLCTTTSIVGYALVSFFLPRPSVLGKKMRHLAFFLLHLDGFSREEENYVETERREVPFPSFPVPSHPTFSPACMVYVHGCIAGHSIVVR